MKTLNELGRMLLGQAARPHQRLSGAAATAAAAAGQLRHVRQQEYLLHQLCIGPAAPPAAVASASVSVTASAFTSATASVAAGSSGARAGPEHACRDVKCGRGTRLMHDNTVAFTCTPTVPAAGL